MAKHSGFHIDGAEIVNQLEAMMRAELEKHDVQIDIHANGEPAIAETKETVNQVEKITDQASSEVKINLDEGKVEKKAKRVRQSISALLSKDYTKGNPLNTLSKAFDQLQAQSERSVSQMSAEGMKAGYNYYSALKGALDSGASQMDIVDYLFNDSKSRMTKGALFTDLGAEVDAYRSKLELLQKVQKEVLSKLGVKSLPKGISGKVDNYVNTAYEASLTGGDASNDLYVLQAQTELSDAVEKYISTLAKKRQAEQQAAQSEKQSADATKEASQAQEQETKAAKEKIAAEQAEVAADKEAAQAKGQSAKAAKAKSQSAKEEASAADATANAEKENAAATKEGTQAAQQNAEAVREAAEAQRELNAAKQESPIGGASEEIPSPQKKEQDTDSDTLRNAYENAEKANQYEQELLENEKKLNQEKEKERAQTEKLIAAEQKRREEQEKFYNTIFQNEEIRQRKQQSSEKASLTESTLNLGSLVDTNGKLPEYSAQIDDLKQRFALAGQTIDMTEGQVRKFIDSLSPEEVNACQQEVDELSSSIKALNQNPFLKQTNKYGAFRGMAGSVKEAKQAFTDIAADSKSFSKVVQTDLGNGMTQFTSNIVTAQNESQKLVGTFKDGKLYTSIKQATQQTSGFAKATQQLGERWRMAVTYLLSFQSLYKILGWVKEGIQTISELDKALTEMSKVSDASRSSLERYARASFDVADAVGTTSKQLQDSTADFLRIGESMDEAAESAKAANVLLNVSEFDNINEATDALISMSAAFKDLSKTEINDVLNKLGNNFAVSTDGLATALQASASALKTAQNDFYEAAALVTAGNTITQDPNKVGTGLRTIALRLTGTEAAKQQLADLGEDVDDFVVTTTSKMDQQIKNLTKTQDTLGVSLLDMNGNYRSTYEILLDIAKVWDKIAEEDKKTGNNRQNALLEMMAGKNRSNILASILQNPEVLEDAYKQALDSAGSAQEELEKYLDSIEGRTTKLKNQLQELSYVTFDSDVFKKILNGATDALSVVTSLVEQIGSVPLLAAGISGGLALKGHSIIGQKDDGKFGFKTPLKPSGITDELKQQFEAFADAFNGSGLSVEEAAKKAAESVGEVDDSIIECAQSAKNGSVSLNDYAKFMATAGNAGKALVGTLKTVAANMLFWTVLTKAVELGADALDKWVHRVQYSRDALNDSNDAFDEASSKLEDLQTQLDETAARMAELETDGIAVVEQEEYDRLVQTNAELERQIELQKFASRNAARESADDAMDLYNKRNLGKEEVSFDAINDLRSTRGVTELGASADDINDYLAAYLSEQELIKDLEAKFANATDEDKAGIQHQLEEEYAQLEQFEADILSYSNDYQAILDGLEAKKVVGLELTLNEQSAYDAANNALNIITTVLESPEFSVQRFIDKEGIEEQITELVGDGKDVSAINTALQEQFPELAKLMKDVGYSAEDLAKKYAQVADAAKEISDAPPKFDIATHEDEINDFQSEITSIYSALGKSINGELTETELLDLKQEFPDLANGIRDVSDSLTYLADVKIKDFIDRMKEAGATDDMIRLFRNIVDEAKDAAGVNFLPSSTITDSVKRLASQLEPQFAQLGEAYQNIFTADGFTLENVDNTMLESLRSSFEDIESTIGVAFDETQVDRFFDTITNGASSAEQVQQAFNDLATAYFYSTDVLDTLNEETAKSIEQQLEEMGVTNAHQVVMAALAQKELEAAEAKRYMAETSESLATATGAEIAAFGNELIAAGACTQELARFYLEKALANSNVIQTQADVDNLMRLAEAAGVAANLIAGLKSVNGDVQEAAAAGDTAGMMQAGARQKWVEDHLLKTPNTPPTELDLDFKVPDLSGATGAAGAAGAEAGDAYVDAYEKEVEKLDKLKDQGKITEKEYLDYLRALYQKYFKDKEGYLDKYAEEENKYLQGMKDLYASAFGTIVSKYDDKIDAANEAKDAAVDALEKEKDAAVDALEAQKEAAEAAYQAQIESRQTIIDGLQDEIDSIREANEEREREKQLEQDLYNLERAKHQRDKLVYKDGQMKYVSDPNAVRDAQDAVEDTQTDIEIAEKEKQITALEKEIDSIQSMIDKSNDYYDKLIEQTEKSYDEMIAQTEAYWDSVIQGLESYRDRYQQLADMESDAKALADLQQICEAMGVTVDQVMGMSDEAFNAFRDSYLGILGDIYSGNDQMIGAIAETAGVASDQLGSYLQSTQGYIDSLSGIDLTGAVQGLTDAADGLEKVAESSERASTNVSAASDGMSGLGTSTSGISENLSGISSGLESINNAGDVSALTESFNLLAEAIKAVSAALGLGEEDTVGGLVGALSSLNEISLEGEEGIGIISQFNNLATAVQSVTSAIAGGGSGGEEGGGAAAGGKGKGGGAGAGGSEEGEGAGSLVGAFDALKAKADETLGAGGGEGEGAEGGEGEGGGSGVIGQFKQLETAVGDVTAAIGSGEGGEESEGGGEGAANTLTSAITGLGETTTEVMGESGGEGLIGQFEQFRDTLGEANEHVTGISDALTEIDGQEVECTIHVNIETTGGIPGALAAAGGTALSDMNLASNDYVAKKGSAHVEGTAKLSGDWAVHKGGQSLVGELGQELVVRDGRFFTVGDNGAEFVGLQPGDIVFNHKQTEALLKNGRITSRGNAYSDGSTGYSYADGSPTNMALSSIDPKGYLDLVSFTDAKPVISLDGTMKALNDQVGRLERQLEGVVPTYSPNAPEVSQIFNISLPNVTDSTKASELMRDLQSISVKKWQALM